MYNSFAESQIHNKVHHRETKGANLAVSKSNKKEIYSIQFYKYWIDEEENAMNLLKNRPRNNLNSSDELNTATERLTILKKHLIILNDAPKIFDFRNVIKDLKDQIVFLEKKTDTIEQDLVVRRQYEEDAKNGWKNYQFDHKKKIEVSNNIKSHEWKKTFINEVYKCPYIVLEERGYDRINNQRIQYNERHICKMENFKNENGVDYIIVMSYTYRSDMFENRKSYLKDISYHRKDEDYVIINIPFQQNIYNIIPLMFVKNAFEENNPDMVSSNAIDYAKKAWNINHKHGIIPAECKNGVDCKHTKEGHYAYNLHPYI